MNRDVEIGRFKVRAEDGTEYEIVEYQEYIPAGHQQDPVAEVKGLKRRETANGLHVTRVDSETFKIVEIDQVVRKNGE